MAARREDIDRADEVAPATDRFSVKARLNLNDLLKKVDAVSIVTPTKYHFEVADLILCLHTQKYLAYTCMLVYQSLPFFFL